MAEGPRITLNASNCVHEAAAPSAQSGVLAGGTDPIAGAPPQGRGWRSDAVADRDCSQDLGPGSAGANGQPRQNTRPCLWPQPRAPRVMPWSRGCLNRPSSPPDRWWARGAGPAAELGFSVRQHGWFNGLKFAGPPRYRDLHRPICMDHRHSATLACPPCHPAPQSQGCNYYHR